jgi:hypothetical protein
MTLSPRRGCSSTGLMTLCSPVFSSTTTAHPAMAMASNPAHTNRKQRCHMVRPRYQHRNSRADADRSATDR